MNKVEKLRQRKVRKEVDALKERIEAWVAHNMAYLEDAEPEPALGLTDRGDDVAEPILAIADRAGEKRAKKARQAMTALLGETNRSDDDVGVELLRDIHMVWPKDVPFISTQALLSKLCDLEERPWATWSRGNPMTGRALAGRLNEFDIGPDHKAGIIETTPFVAASTISSEEPGNLFFISFFQCLFPRRCIGNGSPHSAAPTTRGSAAARAGWAERAWRAAQARQAFAVKSAPRRAVFQSEGHRKGNARLPGRDPVANWRASA